MRDWNPLASRARERGQFSRAGTGKNRVRHLYMGTWMYVIPS